jgi:hypothetical protein
MSMPRDKERHLEIVAPDQDPGQLGRDPAQTAVRVDHRRAGVEAEMEFHRD